MFGTVSFPDERDDFMFMAGAAIGATEVFSALTSLVGIDYDVGQSGERHCKLTNWGRY
jgi:hypothetical protein